MPAETVANTVRGHCTSSTPVVALRLEMSVVSASSDLRPRLSHVVALRLSAVAVRPFALPRNDRCVISCVTPLKNSGGLRFPSQISGNIALAHPPARRSKTQPMEGMQEGTITSFRVA